MEPVLLTGATGFIGSHLAETLLKKKVPLYLFVRRRTSRIDRFEKDGAGVFVAPPDNRRVLKTALNDAGTVIHCAGAVKAVRESDYFEANVGYTDALLRQMSPGQRILYISSQAAAGPSKTRLPMDESVSPRPVSTYGKSKLLAEERVREWGRKNSGGCVILRPSVVYGPREEHLYVCFKWAQRGLLVNLGFSNPELSIVHVDDLVNAVLAAVRYASAEKTYFISGDTAYRWQDIGRMIGTSLGRPRLTTLKIPLPLVHVAACGAEVWSRVSRRPALLSRQKMNEMRQSAWVCSNAGFKTDFHWAPKIPLEKGIRMTAGWYKERGWL